MFKRKSQLSVETMIIYGLVILVALSVIGVLIYFNILDLGSYLPNRCDMGGTGDLKCEEMQFSGTTGSGTLELGIRNIGQKAISLLTVAVTDNDGIHFTGEKSASAEYETHTLDQTNAESSGTVYTLPPGEIASVHIDTGSVLKGKMLRATLNTQYKFKDGVITQKASGTLRIKAS
jgi:hypothetical protein